METFLASFQKHLTERVTANPGGFMYGVDGVPKVVESMRKALKNGSYFTSAEAVKLACKELGIKPTYKAIEEFIANNP